MTKRAKWILIAVVALAVVVPIGVVGLVVGLAIHGHQRAVQAGNEAAAAITLDTISVAQIHHHTENGSFGSFDQLIDKGYLDRRFAGATPTVYGYIYVLRVTTASAGQKPSFTLNADPESPDTGTKHFFIDDKSSTVRVNPNQPASANDPPYGR